MVIQYIRQDIQMLAYHSLTSNMAYLKYASISNYIWLLYLMLTQINVRYTVSRERPIFKHVTIIGYWLKKKKTITDFFFVIHNYTEYNQQ